MVRLVLVRHGETEWNVREVFRGRRDVVLNQVGIKQAELLGECLADWPIEAVYSSPLKRALDTAARVAGHHGLPVTVAEGLVDFDYGRWEGLTHQEVKERYPGLYEQWLTRPHLLRVPEREDLDDVRARAMGFVCRVLSEHEGTVVLVSHRVVNKVLLCSMLGLDNSHFWDIRQDLGAFTVFDHEEGRFTLVLHNERCHLRQLQKDALSDF